MFVAMGDPYWMIDGSEYDYAYYGSDPDTLTYVVPVDYDFGPMEFYITYSEDGIAYNSEPLTEIASVEVTMVDGEYRYEFSFDGDGSAIEDGYYTFYTQFEGGDPFVVGYCRVGDSPAQ